MIAFFAMVQKSVVMVPANDRALLVAIRDLSVMKFMIFAAAHPVTPVVLNVLLQTIAQAMMCFVMAMKFVCREPVVRLVILA
jgi:hypothetical protein